MTSTDPTRGYPGAANDQPRQPGGTPTGGRFAPMSRQEPDVSLAHLSDEEYNADGTFEYPPIPRSVAQHVAFWSRVRVPDPILARVRSTYTQHWSEWSEEQMHAWARTDPTPIGGEFNAKAKQRTAWGERFDARAAELEVERPKDLPAVLARPLIRAAQMAKFAQWLETQDQYDEVMATEVDLGEAEPWTVRRCLDVYHLDELDDRAFEDAGNYAGINAAIMQQRLTELVDLLAGDTGAPAT